MTDYIHKLVNSIFQKDSLEQCSMEELEQYVERHPYFGAAQLLLAKKMQSENPEKYPEQLEKTFQYFHNPLWVQHLLNSDGGIEIELVKQTGTEVQLGAIEENGTERTAGLHPVEIESESLFVKPGSGNIESNTSEDDSLTDVTDEPESVNDNTELENNEFKIPGLKIEPIAPGNTSILFQPYHTVDYFASQGIKLNEENPASDKFSKQLKSFTDWLKTMKKLPVSEIESQPLTGNTQKVDQMAEASVREGEVITESMAQIWEKQGNSLKAIEIYNKLSLLEPSKNAYFAAKIEELKKLI